MGWAANAGAPLLVRGGGGTDGVVSGVDVTIENILLASSFTPGSAAFIEKKFAGFAIVAAPVLEPRVYAQFIAGLGLVGFLGWCKARIAA